MVGFIKKINLDSEYEYNDKTSRDEDNFLGPLTPV